MSPNEVPVLIVGGGPVGLTARRLLQRWDRDAVLVEKHAELSPFPRSRLVNVRSMEIFRQLGIDETIVDHAFGPEFGCLRFSDTVVDDDFAVAQVVGVDASIAESPVRGVVTSQDRLEPILLGPSQVRVRFGVELVGLEQDPDGVTASLVDRVSGDHSQVRASYLLAADGASSTVRDLIGIPTVGPGAVGRMTTAVFDADLDRWCGHRPAGVHFLASGMLLPLYPEGGWAYLAPTPDPPEHTGWSDWVRAALGIDEIKLDVLRVQHWTTNAFVAERYRQGRVLLAGDAVHAIPPTGGLGMNIGLADVHNLCWKLAAVLHGWAEPALLDTFQAERKPVAEQTLAQAMANTQLVMQVLGHRQRQRTAGRAPADVELPWSDRYFAQLGLVLGAAYQSAAVVPDGTTPPSAVEPTGDYIPSARPGHRAPHVWLEQGRSSLDDFGEWFTLLTPQPQSWTGQIIGTWPLHVERLPPEHAHLYGINPGGAVLVRPDGHVAARWPHAPSNEDTVETALSAISRPSQPD